jgi:hypothetical protein
MRYLALYDMNRATEARAAVPVAGRREMEAVLMRALVVYCHPKRRQLQRRRARLVLESCAAGAEVRLRDLYARGFQPVLTPAEWSGYLDTPRTAPPWRAMSMTCVVRHADLRLSDLVVRAARDAQGLAGPGAAARRGLPDARRGDKTIRPGWATSRGWGCSPPAGQAGG